VREAVALVRKYASGDKRLVAYVVPDQEQLPTSGDLRGFLEKQLPDYMVPSIFVLLETLPLTPSGKVNRRALPAPEGTDTALTEGATLVAPRDTLELQLVQVWEEILGVRPIGVTHNFFELGGHSLLAVRLTARIQQAVGQQLPLATLFQNATVEHLAAVLRQHRTAVASTFSSLVPMQKGNSNRQPIFFVHPGGGNVLCYIDLVRHLGANQPFYGLQARGLDGEQAPCTQVEEMASHYLELIRTVQSEGPYLLGGWSMGGLVAFEMAQQLQAQGQTVSLLALIDSHAPSGDQAPGVDDLALLASFALDLGLPLQQITFDVGNLRQLSPDERLACIVKQAKQTGVIPPDIELAQVRCLFHVFKCNFQAMNRYMPRAYSGPITLFTATERLDEKPSDEDLDWGALTAGNLTVHEVPGNHYTMVRAPNVGTLAEKLKKHLRVAETIHKQDNVIV